MRKEGGEIQKQRGRSATNSYNSERLMESQIAVLLCYLGRSPKIIQKQFAPYLVELKKQMSSNSSLAQFTDALVPPDQPYHLIDGSGPLVHNYTKLLQLKNLTHYFSKITEKVENEQNRPAPKKRQEIFTQRQTFGQIEMIYPDYDSYYKMSKQEKSHLAQHHPKTKQKDFFVEPRFLVRIEEFAHFRQNDAHKGDVIYIQYEGHTIAGKKVYLVGNQRSLEMWAKQSSNYPIPMLNLPSEEEGQKKKEEQQKKQKDKAQQVINAGLLKLQFSHKFLGHTQKITSISLSQDEYYAISGSADKTVRLWCLRLKICLATYRGHTKTIWDVSFSASGYYFLSGSGDGLMMLWKTDEPHAQRAYHHKSDVYCTAFAKDPSFVISAGEDATVKIWRTLEADLVREIRLGQPIITFNLGFSGAYMATIENDGRVSVLDLLRGCAVNSFYFEGPDRKSDEKESKNRILKMHDVCLSEDERELSCVCSHYVLVYSMDKLEKKVTNNVYTLYKTSTEADKVLVLEPKEVLYLGGEANLTHCSYQSRNVLVVAGHFKH